MSLRSTLEVLFFRQLTGLTSRLRIQFHRFMGMSIGTGCRFERVRVRRPANIRIGDSNALTEGCWLWPVDDRVSATRIHIGDSNYFNRDVMIDACNEIRIGSHNMFGPGVYITDSNHTMPTEGRLADAPMDSGKVVIGNGCWIGAKAIILKDVILGDRCVVGAGAVVTRSVSAGAVVAGVPARPIGDARSARGAVAVAAHD